MGKLLAWAGALVAFSINTYLSYVAVKDSRAAAEAAKSSADTAAQSVAIQREESKATKQSADASAQTIALQRTPTLLISCSGTITEIPNTPPSQLLYISDDPRFVSRTSVTEGLAPTLPFKVLPSATKKCRLYNYGSIPIVNAHLNYYVQFFLHQPGKDLIFKFHPYINVPSENKYDLFIPAIPANSSIVFELINFSYQRAAAVRQPFMTYDAPPDFSKQTYTFHEDQFYYVDLSPGRCPALGVTPLEIWRNHALCPKANN